MNVSWCEIDCPLITVRCKVSEFLDLTFKGQFQLADKNYTAWFSFKSEKMECNFFDLNGADLLLENFFSFKELLKKGYTEFVFSNLGYLNDKLEYIAHEKKIIYKKIQYRLDEEYQLLAVTGKLMNSSVPTESFGNLLLNVGIDLRDSEPPIRLARNRLKVGERVLTQVATSVLLLTKLGKQYMGLLPIFAPDEEFVDNLKVNVHEVNESESVLRLPNTSDCKPELPLSYLIKACGGVLGSIVTFAILTRYTISYRRRVNHPSENLAMEFIGAAVVTPLLSQLVRASNGNTFSSSIAKNFASNYPYSQKVAKHRYIKQNATEQNRYKYKEIAPAFFKRLPQQVIFLNWCIGFYKKLTHPKNVFSQNNVEELLFILSNELTSFFYSQAAAYRKKNFLHPLLTSIQKLSCLIKPNSTCVFITKETDFIIWNNFIRDLCF